MNDRRLTEQEFSVLETSHHERVEKRQADRVKAIFLLGTVWTAQIHLIDRPTVRRYYRKYKKGGVTRLLEMQYACH